MPGIGQIYDIMRGWVVRLQTYHGYQEGYVMGQLQIVTYPQVIRLPY